MTKKQEEDLQKYYDLTGHDFKYLLQGGTQYGIESIMDEIVPAALAAGKKIVWHPHLFDGEDFGNVRYSLEPI